MDLQRIERLDAEVRRLRRVLAVVVIAICGLTLMGQSTDLFYRKSLAAQEIRIVDDQARVFITLGVRNGRPVFLFDGDGDPATHDTFALTVVRPGSVSASLFDPNGGYLNLQPMGVFVKDGENRSRAELAAIGKASLLRIRNIEGAEVEIGAISGRPEDKSIGHSWIQMKDFDAREAWKMTSVASRKRE